MRGDHVPSAFPPAETTEIKRRLLRQRHRPSVANAWMSSRPVQRLSATRTIGLLTRC